MLQLTERHNRFYSPGWARFACGKQSDQQDRFVVDASGALTIDAKTALVVDAEAEPDLFERLTNCFYREFFSTALQRWV